MQLAFSGCATWSSSGTKAPTRNPDCGGPELREARGRAPAVTSRRGGYGLLSIRGEPLAGGEVNLRRCTPRQTTKVCRLHHQWLVQCHAAVIAGMIFRRMSVRHRSGRPNGAHSLKHQPALITGPINDRFSLRNRPYQRHDLIESGESDPLSRHLAAFSRTAHHTGAPVACERTVITSTWY